MEIPEACTSPTAERPEPAVDAEALTLDIEVRSPYAEVLASLVERSR